MKIYNTLSRTKQDFVPRIPGQVAMYVCGMTVYDFCHLGHARVMVGFDIVQRWLRQSGYTVRYVRNITDIDDKIIRRAVENSETISALTERFIGHMNEDAAALGVQPPEFEPLATDYVPKMLELIGILQNRGLAYKAIDDDVNFSVRDFPGYGALSGKSLDDLRAGERVDISSTKRDPLDFVLWKHAKKGEPFWESPWGRGRPGWHIECSAMSAQMLGPQIDIHGGGQDLQFPHHENEIAQSEGAMEAGISAGRFVNTWMHIGFVRVDNEKMSKSLGNFFTIREILKKYDAEVVRFFIVRAHYRSPLNYSDQHLDDARNALSRLYTALKGIPTAPSPVDWTEAQAVRFKAAMDDDLNTPEAVAVLFDLAGEANRGGGTAGVRLRSLAAVLGLLQRDALDFLRAGSTTADRFTHGEIEQLIGQRVAAKQSRNYAQADLIRKKLSDGGIILEDGPKGTLWRRA